MLVACLNSLPMISRAAPQTAVAHHDSVDRYFSKLLVGLQKSRLDSGLKVLLSVDRENPVVALSTCFKAGRAEPASFDRGLPELAAYLRHRRVLAETRPDHQLWAARGARESEQLGLDYSCFTSVLPASELAFGLWLEAQRLRSLRKVPEGAEAIARKRREAWQWLHPRAAAGLQLQLLARSKAPLASASVRSGSNENLAVTLNEHYFSADEAVLTLVGDFDPDQASRWIREYFDFDEPQPDTRQPGAAGAGVANMRTGESKSSELTLAPHALFVGFVQAAPSTADRAALELLARLLTLDTDARAQTAFLSAAGATDFGTEVCSSGHSSLFIAHLTLQPSADRARARAELLRKIASYSSRRPAAAALERAKQVALVRWVTHFASPQQRAALLGRYEAVLGDARLAARQHLALSAVTAEDIQRASKSLVAEHLVILRGSASREREP